MTNWQLKTPVAFIIFNRLDTTEKVFAEIAKAKPQKLFVVADGPRTEREEDAEKCAAARAIIEKVNWDCEVMKNYSDRNLGCKIRPASGIDWVFENVEEAIILEDDCLPNPTFFRFCEELLEKYRGDKRVMLISGDNFHFGWQIDKDYSYYFSYCGAGTTWGWATWKRAWMMFDVDMKLYPEIKKKKYLEYIISDKDNFNFIIENFDRVYFKNIDAWDYQWEFARLINNGLSIIPNVNLVSNIGCGENATHTGNSLNKVANMQTFDIKFPLKHPDFVIIDVKSEYKYIKDFIKLSLFQKAKRIVKKMLIHLGLWNFIKKYRRIYSR